MEKRYMKSLLKMNYQRNKSHFIIQSGGLNLFYFKILLKVKMSLAKRGSSDLSNQTHDFSIFNLYLHYFYFKCLLSNQNRSNFVQDCVKVKDVRMNFLVNSNSHGIGINSARSPNMTCKCDEIACQCFHSSYHVSSVLEAKDLPGKKR